MDDFIDIVFDGPLGAELPRFVDIEGPDGRSIHVGDWMKREDGINVLRIRAGDVRKALDAQTPDPTVYPSDE